MTVVCGRARLGGIPCGVIAVETRSVECTIPADPANPSSESTVSLCVCVCVGGGGGVVDVTSDQPCIDPVPSSAMSQVDLFLQVLSQAGQVWYPDSAFKTAQALQDMNREDLPVIIFANWRGFSGGMRGKPTNG